MTNLCNRFSPPIILLLVVLLIGACGSIVPATTPPQLDDTPGPPVVVTWDTYTAVEFSVQYPPDWTVVTSPAFSPTWVVFTSPDQQAVIVLALNPDDTQVTPPVAAESPLQREEVTVTLADETMLTAALIAPSGEWEGLLSNFTRLIETIE